MRKNFFSSLGALALICFSFYYTESAVEIVKKNDPIMKEIVSVSAEYKEEAVDATLLSNNNITPGISGVEIDVNKSYEKMKKYGNFDTSLLVFRDVTPAISITNNYDKFIVSGNSEKNNISLIFKITTTTNLDSILNDLDKHKVKATFFVEADIILNDYKTINNIYMRGHALEYLTDNKYNKDEVTKINKMTKALIGTKMKYCYLEKEDEETLKNCKGNKMHSFIPSISTSNFPYNDIKNNILNGSIIKLDNSFATAREINSILNYVNQKGYKIEILEKLLNE